MLLGPTTLHDDQLCNPSTCHNIYDPAARYDVCRAGDDQHDYDSGSYTVLI
jgi:hypothetical protein